MEDVLEVYTRPYDPRRPVICMDEVNKQVLCDVHEPLPMQPGQMRREDYEYARGGVLNLFCFCEPLRGWRRVTTTDQRTNVDWAEQIQRLVEVDYPEAERMVLVMDNLNTHTPGGVPFGPYERFPPADARQLANKLEIHHTPKHGSWLNMAEIELSVLSRQCLHRRVPDRGYLEQEVAAWVVECNAQGVPIAWRCTTEDARIKLRRLYPSFEM